MGETPISFEGTRLADMTVRRSSGVCCQRHRLTLYRACTGKYILEEAVKSPERYHPRIRIICFNMLEDLLLFFMTEHPIPVEMTRDFLDRARQCDGLTPILPSVWTNLPNRHLH